MSLDPAVIKHSRAEQITGSTGSADFDHARFSHYLPTQFSSFNAAGIREQNNPFLGRRLMGLGLQGLAGDNDFSADSTDIPSGFQAIHQFCDGASGGSDHVGQFFVGQQ